MPKGTIPGPHLRVGAYNYRALTVQADIEALIDKALARAEGLG